MTEYVMVPKVPTITNEMKARFIGEFSWKEDAPYYDCHGEVHEYVAAHTVPWDLCKTIFKQMYAEFVAAAPQQAAEPVYFIRDKGASKWLEVAETAYRAALAMPSLCETRILYAGHPPAQPEQPAPIQTSEFERGALTAIALIIRCHDAESLAFDILNEMGLNGADCSGLDECDKEDLSQLIGYRGAKLRGLTRPAAPGGE